MDCSLLTTQTVNSFTPTCLFVFMNEIDLHKIQIAKNTLMELNIVSSRYLITFKVDLTKLQENHIFKRWIYIESFDGLFSYCFHTGNIE